MNRTTRSIVLAITCANLLLNSQCQRLNHKFMRPKLAVVVVVDQMRADHLSRFAGVYKHGFGRILREGAIFTNAHHDHAYTVTGAGHATIATGAYPSHNGIVGNNWFDRKENKNVYCSEDTAAPLLGYPDSNLFNGRSPVRMLRTAIGDWLKEASPKSKVYGVGRKDRAAILTAGMKADAAYWYHLGDGRMITSEFYMKSYPQWVDDFNKSRMVDTFFEKGWQKFSHEETYFLAREDSFSAEYDGKHTAFPHAFTPASQKPDAHYYNALSVTPFSDKLILEFSKALVENEKLGEDDAPDILFVGCSAADAVGHRFGPLSQESLDHFLRLDSYLGDFFAFLDERIGKENYLIILSSDHGVMPMPEELIRRGFKAKRFSGLELQTKIRKATIDVSKELDISQRLIRGLSGFGLVVNYDSAKEAGVSRDELNSRLIDAYMRALPIEDIFNREDLADGMRDARPYQQLYAHSFHPERGGDLMLRMKEFYLTAGSHGTSHGSPYSYDTHVPIAFCGMGVRNGFFPGKVRTIDIAPTLADILGVAIPSDLDGQSLYEVILEE
ncbi:MAG: alkaline phosphatase family protein [bacterium]